MQLLALICAVQICCLLPTKPLPPPPSEPLFPLWSCCHDNLLAPQSYLEQGEGTSAALCQWHALTTVRDTVRGRRRSEEVYSVHQNLPSNPGGERNQVFPFQNTHTWHLSRVSTEHWTPCCPVSSPDQNTGKIVAYFTAGNNKMLFIHKGTKNLLETSFTAEKTRLHKLLSKIIPYSSAIDCPIFVMLLVIEWAGWGQYIWDWGDRSCFM